MDCSTATRLCIRGCTYGTSKCAFISFFLFISHFLFWVFLLSFLLTACILIHFLFLVSFHFFFVVSFSFSSYFDFFLLPPSLPPFLPTYLPTFLPSIFPSLSVLDLHNVSPHLLIILPLSHHYQFEDERDAKDAVDGMDGQDIMNKRVRVEISRRGRGGKYFQYVLLVFRLQIMYPIFSIYFSLHF